MPEIYLLKPENALLETKDACDVLAACSDCQTNRKLGVVIGPSGYGKSHVLKQYAQAKHVYYIEIKEGMGVKDILRAIELQLDIYPYGAPVYERILMIQSRFREHKDSLLIVDEADKLIAPYSLKKMEILRGMYDSGSVGIVIAGEPGLERMLKKQMERFANRVGCYVRLTGLTRKEVEKYVSGYVVEPEAMEELVDRATNKRNGCFRLLARTMNNVSKLVKPGEPVTLDVIKAASSMMML
ncbi:AAA family ATPase [Aneurinibacillus danicus]|uniref:ORC1/DEAH AAA+ ATPase domain-containing protein n=1 Tax=Aneurinibacillus danicus TaxID=267746 RepID=A0A511VB13_9BACL|nr:ATP-binding protein [Aneurinibacillus danicus]GEN35108.1 hypothetical protein ADA01nite_25680 [Aneurinibacillus danicus]